ncbi:MAG: penicillin acylase family protein [Actinomycetota bacterium]
MTPNRYVRRFLALAGASSLVVAIALPALAQPPEVPDHLRAFSIIPPGQSGYVSLQEAVTGQFGPHVTDQLDMYASLIDDDDVTEDELTEYFHSQQFGPDEITREYSPTDGVTVYRDSFDIPHIYADTDEAAAFALGYVTAEDRLWHMDVLRHAGRGRLSELLGPDFIATDQTLRRDGYTTAELQRMFDRLDERYGADGRLLQSAVTSYAEGVNARMDEVRADFTLMPAEYPGQGLQLQDWEPIDTVGVVILQLRQFGETAGGEVRNAAIYQQLTKRLGVRAGKRLFRDLMLVNDTTAYPTIPRSEGTFPSQRYGKVNPAAVAIPDNARQLVTRQAAQDARVHRTLKELSLQMPASNFLAVAPAESETGNSLEFGAPQVGYSIPQFFMEIDVHSPTFDFRGPALPGASLLVPLGRGIDYAWSLTTGVSDAVDTRAELLCERSGRATTNSNYYRYKGRCRPMQARTETITVKGADAVRQRIYRTVHGPVVARSTVDGKPVAIVRERFFWNQELATVPALIKINSSSMDSVEEFRDAVSEFTVSFNAVYVDDEHIGYFHLGKYPRRAAGVDPMLPTWGAATWDWTGRIPFSSHPQMIDPEQGWVANWNNKPAVGWHNGDQTFWGPTHRVNLLAERMETLLSGDGKAGLSDVVDVIREAATADGRADALAPYLNDYTAELPETVAPAWDVVSAWIATGSHRQDRDRDEFQDAGAAVAIFDTWFLELVHTVFDDEIGPTNYDLFPGAISDDPSGNNGSSFYSDFSNQLWKTFAAEDAGKPSYCNDRSTRGTETCAEQVVSSLEAAVQQLASSQGADMSAWTWPADYIEFGATGAAHVDPIPWQNRGTYNHAIEVTGTRP